MRKWSTFIVVYFSLIIAVMTQFKVPPVMSILMQEFHVNSVTAGWLMSIFALTGVLLAFPSAVILKRFGPTKSGMFALVCTVLGSIIGALAINVQVLLVGRVIEGVGVALLSVLAPAVVAMNFDRSKLGVPMGILSTWYPIGSMLAFVISHPITEAFGSWRGNWWLDAILALIALVLFAIVVKRPSSSQRGYGQGGAEVSYTEGLKNSRLWLLGLTFMFMVLGRMGFVAWSPKYFTDAFKLGAQAANMNSSIGLIASAPGGILVSLVFNRIKNKNVLLVSCAVIALIFFPMAFLVPQGIMALYLLLTGIVIGFISAAMWVMVPRTMSSPLYIGLGMSVVSLMLGLSNLFAAPLMGYFIAGDQWARAVLPTAVLEVFAVAAIITFVMAERKNKKANHPVYQ